MRPNSPNSAFFWQAMPPKWALIALVPLQGGLLLLRELDPTRRHKRQQPQRSQARNYIKRKEEEAQKERAYISRLADNMSWKHKWGIGKIGADKSEREVELTCSIQQWKLERRPFHIPIFSRLPSFGSTTRSERKPTSTWWRNTVS